MIYLNIKLIEQSIAALSCTPPPNKVENSCSSPSWMGTNDGSVTWQGSIANSSIATLRQKALEHSMAFR